MRTQFLAIATAASMIAASVAMAAPTTTDGTIKALDMTKHSITLVDGTAYTLPANFKDPGLKVGDKVAVMWDKKGSVNEATTVSMVATGTIKTLDMAKHSITLDDGAVYVLPTTFKDPGLKVGEKVAVMWEKMGKVNEASGVTMVQ